MAAVLYEPAFAVIASWFRDSAERTRALLALTVVAGFASVIYVPLAGWLVQTQGWRDALVALAVLLVPLTVLPNATLPGRRPDHLQRQPGQEPATPPATSRPDDVPLGRALRDQTGLTSLLLHYPPSYGHEKTMQSLRLFAEHVMPAFGFSARRLEKVHFRVCVRIWLSSLSGPRSRRRPLSATQHHPTTSLVGISLHCNEP